jgi:hypothetical protein
VYYSKEFFLFLLILLCITFFFSILDCVTKNTSCNSSIKSILKVNRSVEGIGHLVFLIILSIKYFDSENFNCNPVQTLVEVFIIIDFVAIGLVVLGLLCYCVVFLVKMRR